MCIDILYSWHVCLNTRRQVGLRISVSKDHTLLCVHQTDPQASYSFVSRGHSRCRPRMCTRYRRCWNTGRTLYSRRDLHTFRLACHRRILKHEKRKTGPSNHTCVLCLPGRIDYHRMVFYLLSKFDAVTNNSPNVGVVVVIPGAVVVVEPVLQ